MNDPDPDRDPLTELRRWEDSGGTWRVVVRTPERLVVELLTCDAGEVMGRLVATPPGEALTAHVSEHVGENVIERDRASER